jgi:hypothetical protein
MLIEGSKLHQLKPEKLNLRTNLKLRLAIYLTKIKLTSKNVEELVIKKPVLKIRFSKLKGQPSPLLTKMSIIKKKLLMLNIWIPEPRLLPIHLGREKYVATQLLTSSTQASTVQEQIYPNGHKDSNYRVRYTKLQHME